MSTRDYEEALRWLRWLFGDDRTTEMVELRSFQDGHRGGAKTIFTRDPEDMVAHLQIHDKPGRGMYFGELTRDKTAARGRTEDCRELTSFWLDIDTYSIGISKEDAIEALRSAPLPPSGIVDSGGGIQAQWRLTEALLIGTDIEQETVIIILKQLAYIFAGDAKVTDIARVMRVPGTINAKHGEERITTIIEMHEDRDYEASDIAEWLAGQQPLLVDQSKPMNLVVPGEGELNSSNPFVAFGETAEREPMDVVAALEAMEIGNVHDTQVRVSAALIQRGEPRDAVFSRLIDRAREITPKPLAANFESEMTRRIDVIIDSAMQFAPEKVAERRVEAQVEELGDWAEELDRDKKGNPVKSTSNVVMLMAKHEKVSKFLKFNEFTQAIDVMKPTPWRHDPPSEYPREIRDADIHELRVWIEQTMGWINIEDKHIKASIQMSADRLRYHPVRDWLHHCHRTWQAVVEANGGRPRVSQFLAPRRFKWN
jgi:hypothetical protein